MAKQFLTDFGKAVAGLPGQGPNVERFSPRVPVLPSSASDFSRIKQKAVSFETAFSCARRVIFPGRRQSPCGNRKCPGGTFSRKAVTGLSGQGPNGERIYRKFPVFLSKSYITFPDKTKSSLYRLLFRVRVELSSRAVASHLAEIENVPVGHFPGRL